MRGREGDREGGKRKGRRRKRERGREDREGRRGVVEREG